MLESSVDRILADVGPDAVVLDIGGWAKPFCRANYVVDLMAYETRGVLGRQGPEPERFSADTWVQHDISSGEPLPFGDGEIDFAICSHTLEDIRDPIFLCSEINRVAKAGYIEVPSRVCESIMGSRGYVGSAHHRWLVEIENHAVTFRFKSHLIHGKWKYHLPASYRKQVSDEHMNSHLFWEGNFDFREAILFGMSNIAEDLESFVRAQRAYPRSYYWLDESMEKARRTMRQAARRYRPLRLLIETLLRRPLGRDTSGKDEFWREVDEIDSSG